MKSQPEMIWNWIKSHLDWLQVYMKLYEIGIRMAIEIACTI